MNPSMCMSLVVFLLFLASAKADLIVFNKDFAGWQSSVGSFSLEDLDGGSGTIFNSSQSFGEMSIRHFGSDLNGVFSGDRLQAETGSATRTEGDSSFEFLFDSPIYAFGFESVGVGAGELGDSPRDTRMILGSGDSINLNGFGTGFIGFVSDTPITYVQLAQFNTTHPDDDLFFVDNIVFASVPEPSSVGLVALLTCCVVVRRRSHKQRAG